MIFARFLLLPCPTKPRRMGRLSSTISWSCRLQMSCACALQLFLAMARYTIFPHKLLSAPLEDIDELVAVFKYWEKPTDGNVFTATMSSTINNCLFLATKKKMWLEHLSSASGYIAKYQEHMAFVTDAANVVTLENSLGDTYAALLQDIWHLRSTGIVGIVDGTEPQIVQLLVDYSVAVMKFTKSNTVPEDFCNKLTQLLSEASITFPNSPQVLIDCIENVTSEMLQARQEGQRTGMIELCIQFLRQKTTANYEALEKQILALKGLAFPDDAKIQNVAHVLMEDLCKHYPASSQFSDSVASVLEVICNDFLRNNVLCSHVTEFGGEVVRRCFLLPHPSCTRLPGLP